jgi:hypothetical protein
MKPVPLHVSAIPCPVVAESISIKAFSSFDEMDPYPRHAKHTSHREQNGRSKYLMVVAGGGGVST